MHIPKKFFEDKLALTLSSLGVLTVIISVILILLRLNLSSGSNFIISYRANLGIEAFKSGGVTAILSFIVFAVIVLALELLLAWRIYNIERRLAIGVLSVGLFLLFMCLVVSNALLALH